MARTRFRPLALGTVPASTAGSPGSSSCRMSCAPGTRARTSATWAAIPSASEAVRSLVAPRSASAGSWLWASSMVAAIVHGPQAWILSAPR